MMATLRSLFNLVTGRLRFPDDLVGRTVEMEDGSQYRIFRHMRLRREHGGGPGSVLIVRFRFEKGTQESNVRKSRIPIMMIAGCPGFRAKLWMVDEGTGYWQGLYHWDDVEAIERYKDSFVLRLMNGRAERGTVSYRIVPDRDVDDLLGTLLVEDHSVQATRRASDGRAGHALLRDDRAPVAP